MLADGRLKRGSVGLNCVMLDSDEPTPVVNSYIAGDKFGNVLQLNISSDEIC